MKLMWVFCGTMIGLTSLSIALGSVPSTTPMHVTDDTAIYQRLSEIKVPREARPNFDSDVERLSDLEPRYRENLPSVIRDPRLAGPMKRIAKQGYRYSGQPQKPVVKN
jgi:hypothetical protein